MIDNIHHRTLAKLASSFVGHWNYLEIGCCEGGSLLPVIESGYPESVHIIDTWGEGAGGSGRGSHQHIIELLKDKYTGELHFHDGDSLRIAAKLLDEDYTFDLINVDGSHEYNDACTDLFHCWPMVCGGGYLVFDDITHPEHLNLRYLAERFSRVFNVQPIIFDTDTDYGVSVWKK